MRTDSKLFNQLIEHMLGLRSRAELADFLGSILTPAELQELPRRLEIIKQLKAGVPQREIAQKLGLGIATVTRGARVVGDKAFRKL